MPQTSDLLDIRGIGQRGATFRFDWLDNDLRRLGELHPMRDDRTPLITCDSTRSVFCDMSNFTLTPEESEAVDRLRHRVKPHMVLEDGTEWPLGVYVWADASKVRESWGLPSTSSLVDLGIALNQPTSATVAFVTGMPVRTCIVIALAGARIAATVDSTDALLVAPISWPAGTLRWQVVADLCALGGYLLPHFDMDGNCVVSTAPDLAALPDPVVSFAEGRNIYAATPVETDDLLQTPNRFTVIGTSATNTEVAGTYDVPASAPYSYYNRGFYVTEVITQQGVASSTEAAAAAKAYALTRTIYEHVTFSCPPDPRVEVYDTVEYLDELWFVQATSITLSPAGPMTITARKVYS